MKSLFLQVTSEPSTNFVDFADRIGELDREGANIERLLTSGVGINAEGGEFLEIIKKMVFQGKPWNEDNREHLIIELGDIMWYVAQATSHLVSVWKKFLIPISVSCLSVILRNL